MNIRSKRLKTRNLPQNNRRIDRIDSKPYAFIIVTLLGGAYLIYSKHYFLGSIITVIFLYNLLCIKNKVIMEFYEEYVVFYAEQEKDECYILFWEDILSWSYHIGRNDLDSIEVLLKDHKKICFKSLSKRKTVRYFSKYVPKTSSEIFKQHIQ